MHNSIYHHHHEDPKAAAMHHQQEQARHQHLFGDSHGHEHSPHFVHSEDFGTSTNTSITLLKLIKVPACSPAITLYIPRSIQQDILSESQSSAPDGAPPLSGGYSSSRHLRGPPLSIA
jgi:hypothetical protein